jgi:hypothetical protein
MKLNGIVASESYNVYSQIDQLKVWQSLLGITVTLNTKMVNTLRRDTRPGCWLYEHDNIIRLADFADSRFHRITCVTAVMIKYHCDYTRALEIIKQDFSYVSKQLKLSNKVTKDDFKFHLSFNKGAWNNQHKDYWSQYGISKSQLESENCYAVSSYSFNTHSCPDFLQKVKVYDETTAIVVDSKIKIYKPNSPFKFLSNFNENTIGGTNRITDTVVITKSAKDYMVLDNLGYSSRFIHSETSNPDLLSYVRYDKVYVLMDNDITGLNACKRLSSNNHFIGISIPEGYPKDISDFYKTYGHTETKHLIRQLIPKNSTSVLSSVI